MLTQIEWFLIVSAASGQIMSASARRLRSMGIPDRPTSPRSPWQNGYAERLIGSIRRECLDQVVAFGARHLRHVLLSYINYYGETRTHLSLDKDSTLSRTVKSAGAYSFAVQFLADCITNMSGFDLRQARHPAKASNYLRLSMST